MLHRSVRIVVLNYNGIDHLEKLLPSLKQAVFFSQIPIAIDVLDNRSTDSDVEWIRLNHPDIKCVVAKANDFLFSYNRYLKEVTEDLVLLLNNDLRVDEGFIDPLIGHFSDPDVFAVSATSRDWNGSQYTWGPIELNSHHGCYYWYPEKNRHELGNTLFCSGGFMAVDRSKFLLLGGFNRLFYPAYGEDLDLCFRAWRMGWKCLFEPRSVVFHRESGTWDSQSTRQKALNLRASLLFQWASLPSLTPFWRSWAFHTKTTFEKISAGEWWYPICFLRTWLEWMRTKPDHRSLKVSRSELDEIMQSIASSQRRP